LQFLSPNPDVTLAAARLLAGVLPEQGLLIVLSGPLGAGKTVFAKGVAAGLGINPGSVTSPTFGICSEYPLAGGRRLAHVDGYRLTSIADLEGTGFLDLLVPGTLVLMEWGERFRDALPADRLELVILRPDQIPNNRCLNAVASGPVAESVLTRWKARLSDEAELDVVFGPPEKNEQ
jgi:tRNA threonylcarbamoyladenosine biosynthesis protein TsaE